MEPTSLKDYRILCERIGKLYSDLETLEEKRAELERRLSTNNGAPGPGGPAPSSRVGNYRVDKQAVAKTDAFLKHHFIANKVCTVQTLVNEFGCTKSAADSRLRAAARRGMGVMTIRPIKLERP